MDDVFSANAKDTTVVAYMPYDGYYLDIPNSTWAEFNFIDTFATS